jgi:hypothetical protein
MWWFPLDASASLTLRVFGAILICALIVTGLGLRRSRRVAALGVATALAASLFWTALYLSRPAWMRYALDPRSPAPRTVLTQWTTRADGLETAEASLSVDGHWVDQVLLSRIDPARYRFVVRWAQPKPIEDWQQDLGAAVVMNGSYFLPDHTPQTPLRAGGNRLGPQRYESQHAAFIGDRGEILDLRGLPLPKSIDAFSDAMVSYPLLCPSRAQGQADWLASRSFIAVDGRGRVLFGTSRTGYFSLQRLAAWLQAAPLDVRIALNLDGGPIASQAVSAPGYSRVQIGSAETNRGADVLRAFFQSRRTRHWSLPIIVAALPRAT